MPPWPSLSSTDELERTFLFYALEVGAKEIAKMLLDEFKNDNNILSQPDIKERTLIWIAASQGYGDIIAMLIQHKKMRENNLWLKADVNGLTPLHIAARNGHHEVVKILLAEIKKEVDPYIIINQFDAKGKTPLYYAFRGTIPHLNIMYLNIIAELIQAGADINLHVEDETYFSILSRMSSECQLYIFTSLDKGSQIIFLRAYQVMVKKFPDRSELKAIYHQCAGKYSLHALLIAHLPSYARNFFLAKRKTEITIPCRSQTKQIQHYMQLVDKDIFLLTEIRKEIREYLYKLIIEEINPTSFSYKDHLRHAPSITPFSCSLLYIGYEILQREGVFTEDKMCHPPSHLNFFFMITSLFIGLGIFAFSEDMIEEKEYMAHKRNWQAISEKLKLILSELQSFKNRELGGNISEEMRKQALQINQLNDEITILEEAQPIEKIKLTFKIITEILDKLITNFYKIKRPFTLTSSTLFFRQANQQSNETQYERQFRNASP